MSEEFCCYVLHSSFGIFWFYFFTACQQLLFSLPLQSEVKQQSQPCILNEQGKSRAVRNLRNVATYAQHGRTLQAVPSRGGPRTEYIRYILIFYM